MIIYPSITYEKSQELKASYKKEVKARTESKWNDFVRVCNAYKRLDSIDNSCCVVMSVLPLAMLLFGIFAFIKSPIVLFISLGLLAITIVAGILRGRISHYINKELANEILTKYDEFFEVLNACFMNRLEYKSIHIDFGDTNIGVYTLYSIDKQIDNAFNFCKESFYANTLKKIEEFKDLGYDVVPVHFNNDILLVEVIKDGISLKTYELYVGETLEDRSAVIDNKTLNFSYLDKFFDSFYGSVMQPPTKRKDKDITDYFKVIGLDTVIGMEEET